MDKKLIYRIIGAVASALIIVAVFVPFVNVYGYTSNLWKIYELAKSLYLPIMIIVFGIIGIVFFALNIKTEFAYMSTGAITFFVVMETINAINNDSFKSLSIGYYCLVVAAILTGVMAFLVNTKSKTSDVAVTHSESENNNMLENINQLYDSQIQPVEPVQDIAISEPQPVVNPVQDFAIPEQQPAVNPVQDFAIPEQQPVVNPVQDIAIPEPQPAANPVQDFAIPEQQPAANPVQDFAIPEQQPAANPVQDFAIPEQQPAVNPVQDFAIPEPQPAVNPVQDFAIPEPQPAVNSVQDFAIPEQQPAANPVQDFAIPEPQPTVNPVVQDFNNPRPVQENDANQPGMDIFGQ